MGNNNELIANVCIKCDTFNILLINTTTVVTQQQTTVFLKT